MLREARRALTSSFLSNMIYNYHTHTARCGHAVDADEDYVRRAIEAGIKYLGFSDHAPLVFPDGYEGDWRVPTSEAEEYVTSIRHLREKYKDKLQLNVGFEMEYYPRYFEQMFDSARKIGAEYLILGQHFILNEHPDGIGSVGPTDDERRLSTYVDEVITAMNTGVFTYVAHPDITCFIGDGEVYRLEITRLCLASRESGVPLEINLLGIRNKKHYPAETFWHIAGEVGAPVTIGFDAHASRDFLNKEQHIKAAELIEKYNLNYIGMPKLRFI